MALHELRFGYNPSKIERIKKIPGVKPRYKPATKPGAKAVFDCWLAPHDAMRFVAAILEEDMPNYVRPTPPPVVEVKGALPFQEAGVANLLHKRDFMLVYEPGLGKTPTTIWALKECHKKLTLPVLIVAPANVREHWRREITKWWSDHPPVTVIEKGADWNDAFPKPGQIVICSYELIAQALLWEWGVVVLDESHYVKEGRYEHSKRSQNVAFLRERNPLALFWLLTGTPISNEPKDLWHQLEVMLPGHFGTYWQFAKRYCNVREHEYGTDVSGVNAEHAAELQERLSFYTQRVTKHEVAHLLPALRVSTLYVKQRHLKGLDELAEAALEGYQEASADKKISAVVELFEEHRQAGRIRFAALTHLKSTVAKLAGALRAAGYNVLEVTGDVSERERYVAMDEARAATKPTVFVATMHAVLHGVDLTFAETVAYAEMYWQPSVMVQSLGRFNRLSGTHAVNAYFIVCGGTREEAISGVVTRKIEAMSQLIAKGAGESALDVLAETATDEALASELEELCKTLS